MGHRAVARLPARQRADEGLSIDQLALFAEPAPQPLNGGTLIGTRRGALEGLATAAQRADVRAGPRLGWRCYSELVAVADCTVQVSGRLLAGPTFNIGSPKASRDQSGADGPARDQSPA
jgi:hypothetical protein